jgi:hypothetical protein
VLSIEVCNFATDRSALSRPLLRGDEQISRPSARHGWGRGYGTGTGKGVGAGFKKLRSFETAPVHRLKPGVWF